MITENQGKRARLISFYLPQFYPTPENDRWWGKGFTDWTKVSTAGPLFNDHYQPHIPADLGFYDLRLPETRKAQAELAKEHGIEGFCYWHYWFKGKRLLERPFNEILNSGEPDFPFCLAWANENWTRRWDGLDREILQEQMYGGKEDELAHFTWLLKSFKDSRYLRIDGKPIFLIYRPAKIPNVSGLISFWRHLAESEGLPGLFLIAIKTDYESKEKDWLNFGFDGVLLHHPNWSKIAEYRTKQSEFYGLTLNHPGECIVFDYTKAAQLMAKYNDENVKNDNYFGCVLVGWDNAPRHGRRALVLKDSSPDAYERWLRMEVERVSKRNSDKKIVFINAWNEWAEGMHLEPDLKFGRGFLEATKRALDKKVSPREINEKLAGLAKIEMETGNFKKAEEYFLQALQNNPEAANIRHEYAVFLQSAKLIKARRVNLLRKYINLANRVRRRVGIRKSNLYRFKSWIRRKYLRKKIDKL